MDIYNPARVKHAFFPRCSFCGRLWLRARPSLRTQYVAMHVISPSVASLTHKRNRHHAAIILQSSCKDCSTLLLQACFCSYPCAIILQAVICIHMLWTANIYIYIYSVMEPCIHVCTTTFTEINLSFFRVPLPPEFNIVCKSA